MKKFFLYAMLFVGPYCVAQNKKLFLQLGAGSKPNFIRNTAPKGGIVDCALMYRYKNFSAGPYIAYASATLTYMVVRWEQSDFYPGYLQYEVHYRWNFALAGIKSCYHLRDATDENRFGFYVGGIAARSFANERCENDQPPGPPAKFRPLHFHNESLVGIFAGSEYKITDKGNLFAELGYGITYFNAGMQMKF